MCPYLMPDCLVMFDLLILATKMVARLLSVTDSLYTPDLLTMSALAGA